MSKKMKKISIGLIVLLMVIAGTLAWLVTSDFKKGKIGASNYSLQVEAVRPATEEDYGDDTAALANGLLGLSSLNNDALLLGSVPIDGFVLNDAEIKILKAKRNNESVNVMHYTDSNVYPITMTNTRALFDEDKVPTKYIRITNSNDDDAVVEISAMAANSASAKNATGVSWLIGAPDGYESYIDDTDSDELLTYKAPVLFSMLDNSSRYYTSYVDHEKSNDSFYLDIIGLTSKERIADELFEEVEIELPMTLGLDENGDPVEQKAPEANKETILLSKINYEDYDEGKAVESLLQRNVIRVESGSTIYGLSRYAKNSKTALANDVKSLANILHAEHEFTETYSPATCEYIDGNYVLRTMKDTEEASFSLPIILRAHTSVVVPFKVFLNEDWDTSNTEFDYYITVGSRNYTDGDEIVFGPSRTQKDLIDELIDEDEPEKEEEVVTYLGLCQDVADEINEHNNVSSEDGITAGEVDETIESVTKSEDEDVKREYALSFLRSEDDSKFEEFEASMHKAKYSENVTAIIALIKQEAGISVNATTVRKAINEVKGDNDIYTFAALAVENDNKEIDAIVKSIYMASLNNLTSAISDEVGETVNAANVDKAVGTVLAEDNADFTFADKYDFILAASDYGDEFNEIMDVLFPSNK